MFKQLKRAVILAGGKGTRLRPYTVLLPKPLMPVGDYSILEIIIKQLAFYGFTHITITVNHLADIIVAMFADGRRWGVKIDYSFEDRPLGTMGPLRRINGLPDDFLVMNGDVLTDLNYAALYGFHRRKENVLTVSTCCRQLKSEFGVIVSSRQGEITHFKEKPFFELDVSMGIYMLKKRVLDYIPKDKAYGFDDLMLKMLRRKEKLGVKPFNGYWLDIGRPDDYAKAIDDLEINKHKFPGF